MKSFDTHIRVEYHHTDQMGIVHHSNYVKFFEFARTEWLRAVGLTYAEMERRGVMMPIVEVQVKYQGYIARQLAEVARHERLESKSLSPDLDYKSITGLRIEAAQKLNAQKPLTVGQASRISGVSPADISVLLIYLGLH